MDLHESVIAHQTTFALRLIKHVASGKYGQGNVAISPVSIQVVLALLAAGAKGKTLDEIVSLLVGPNGTAAELHALATKIITCVLGANGAGVGGPVVSWSNDVFVDASLTLNPSFIEIVTDKYKSEAKAFDFQNKTDEVLQTINTSIEKVTRGLIREPLSRGSLFIRTQRFVFVNALHFEASWIDKFNPSETRDAEFHLLDGTSVQTPFMTSRRYQYVSSYDGFKALMLPYQMDPLNCDDIFLPDARDGIWSLQERLIAGPDFCSRHLPAMYVPVGKFKLPRFTMSFRFDASAALKDLGVVSAFSGSDADFSKMIDYDLLKKV